MFSHPTPHWCSARSALVVGHPGHELRVYGWLRLSRPVVHILTDGSGSDGLSRVASSTILLEDAGASRGSIYGRLTDREIYSAILAGDHRRCVALADELADALASDHIELVAGDAIEGFNPSHDVCRYITNAAVRLATTRTGRPIACYAFPLDAAPDAPPGPEATAQPGAAAVDALTRRVDLDDEGLERKLAAAHAYGELRSEVARTLARFGAGVFRTETLVPVDLRDPYGWDPGRIPFYETYGAARVASGRYQHVVTFREHVQPLADALWSHSAVPD